MAKAKFDEYDSTAANNTDVGGVDIQGTAAASNMDDGLREVISHIADHFARDTIASASTTDIGSKAAHFLSITGTTDITSFGTVKAGTWKLLHFAGSLKLTYNATTMILTGKADITTEAGGMALVISEGSGNWRMVGFIRATEKGDNVASATTINLNDATGSFVDITGTTTVTTVTLAEGKQIMARASAAFQITAGNSLIVNGSTTINYTTTTNDLLLFEGYGSSVVRVWVIGIADTPVGTTRTQTLTNKTNQAPDGSNSAPPYSFASDPDTGIRTPGVGSISCVIAGSEVWRQDATNTLIGKTSSSAATAGIEFSQTGIVTVTRDSNSCVTLRRLTDEGGIQLFQQDGNSVGSISVTSSATAYNTSSDERLKKFTGEYSSEDAIAIIKADPVRRFEWKSTGEKAIGWGAQTSYKVSSDLATPGKGKPGSKKYEPWGVDHSKRTPYLWAAMSALIDRVEELEKRIAELSNAA